MVSKSHRRWMRPRLTSPATCNASQYLVVAQPSAQLNGRFVFQPKTFLPLKGMTHDESPGKSRDSAGAPGCFAGDRRDQIHPHRHVHLSRDWHLNP
jgi:hypothetical protein